MVKTAVSRKMIVEGLMSLGLKRGDDVLVHSAFSSLGYVEDGPRTVIEALLEVVGSEGTVMMPWPLGNSYLARVFSEQPGVISSQHPTHAVSATGARARMYLKNHLESPTACGPETPYGRLIKANGYILLLGVDQDRNTTLHAVEEMADAPYLSEKTVTYVDADGQTRQKTLKKFPGPHRNFIGLDRLFREEGMMRVARIGNAVVRLLRAGDMAEVALTALRKDPAAFLCANPNCADCVSQRGRIKQARLQQESFILTAFSSELVADLKEMLAILQGQGISHLELGRVAGRSVLEMTPVERTRLRQELKAHQFSVSAINPEWNRWPITEDPDPDLARFREILKVAQFFDCQHLVISSFKVPAREENRYRDQVLFRLTEMVKLARDQHITLLLENEPGFYAASSDRCADLVESVGSLFLRLAFNPANFARGGEKPFLGISSHIRKMAGQVYINDALFSGSPQLPGQGNAEIKELISILRCRSFDSFFCLKPGLGAGKENFNRAAECFWQMLAEM